MSVTEECIVELQVHNIRQISINWFSINSFNAVIKKILKRHIEKSRLRPRNYQSNF